MQSSSDKPMSWLLDNQVGWKTSSVILSEAEVSAAEGYYLELATEPFGPRSFLSWVNDLGGLVLPCGMAVDIRGRLYLAGSTQTDKSSHRDGWIKRLDPVTQRFIPLPLFVAGEQGARRFADPVAIACAGRNLYIIDGADHRLLVFDWETLALRHIWDSAEIQRQLSTTGIPVTANPRDPKDIATDGNLTYILDENNQCVYLHRVGTEAIQQLSIVTEQQNSKKSVNKSTPQGLVESDKSEGLWTRIAVDSVGDLYLLNMKAAQPTLDVYTVDAKTRRAQFKQSVRSAGAVQERFDPTGIVVDCSAPQDGDIAWRFCLPAKLVDDLHFQIDDLKDPLWLTSCLAAASDPLSKYLKERLTGENKKIIETYQTVQKTNQELTRALVQELNRHLTSHQIFTEERFAHVQLSSEVKQLTKTRVQGQERFYLNRLLLEQAYPRAFKPSTLVVYGLQIPVQRRPSAESASLRQCLTSIPAGLVFDRQGQRLTDLQPIDLCDAKSYRTTGRWISKPLDSEVYQCQWHRLEVELGNLSAGRQVTISTYTSEKELSDSEIAALALEGTEVFASWDVWDKSYTFTGTGALPSNGKPSSNLGAQKTTGDLSATQFFECLVQSRQGRYLWVRLDLQGDGLQTPFVSSIRVHYPRISYLDYLPAVFSNDDDSRWFLERLLSIFQFEWDKQEQRIAEIYRYFDPQRVPESHLEYLATWLALPLEGEWTSQEKRSLLAAAPSFYTRRGTITSIREFLQVYLHNMSGIRFEHETMQSDCSGRCDDQIYCKSQSAYAHEESWRDYPMIVEGFRERAYLMLGQEHLANLGEGAALWGPAAVGRLQLDVFAHEGEVRLVSTGDPESDLFRQFAHRFRVFVPAAWVCTAEDERMLRRALDAEKPAHTQYDLCLVEARLRVGLQSMVGIDTIIGANPTAQLTGAEAEAKRPSIAAPRHTLGYDTVLAGQSTTATDVRLAPHVQVGLDTILQ